MGVAFDDLEHARVVALEDRAVTQKFGVGHDAGQGRAQLVRERGDQIVLRAVEVLELLHETGLTFEEPGVHNAVTHVGGDEGDEGAIAPVVRGLVGGDDENSEGRTVGGEEGTDDGVVTGRVTPDAPPQE